MISSIGSGNPIQMLSAANAFNAAKPIAQEEIMPQVSDDINIADNNNLLDLQNVNEIREYAKIVGEENISNDDIKYGLTYGRSVIADYVI